MEDTTAEIVSAAKVILGISDDGSDELIELIAEDTVNAVLSYCRLDVLPRQLVSLIPHITAKRFNAAQRDGVKTITEGERRVEYFDGGSSLPEEYVPRLKPFVSRAVKVPSDLERDEND